MRPPEVLDRQAALVDYLSSRHYIDYLQVFIADMARTRKFALKGDSDQVGREFADIMRRSMSVAEAFHVAREMMPVLRASAAELEPTDYLVHERLPAEHGFLVFDDGWVTREIRGRTITINALQWWHGAAASPTGTRVPGIWTVQYTDVNDPRDEVTGEQRAAYARAEDVMRMFGRYQVQHLSFMPYGTRVGPYEVPEGFYDEYVTEFPESDLPGIPVRGKYDGPLPNDTRMLVALFRLLGQTFVEVRDAPLDRATERRMKRANLPARVQTVTLRRKITRYLNPGEGGTVQWQHSWWVKGTWQWRACGAEHPLAEPADNRTGFHARVYVRGHPKGDPTKPMLITGKVGSLRR